MTLWRQNSLEALRTALPCCDHCGDVRKSGSSPCCKTYHHEDKGQILMNSQKARQFLYYISSMFWKSRKYTSSIRMNKLLALRTESKYLQSNQASCEQLQPRSFLHSSASWFPTLNVRTLFCNILGLFLCCFPASIMLREHPTPQVLCSAHQTLAEPFPSLVTVLENLAGRHWQRLAEILPLPVHTEP